MNSSKYNLVKQIGQGQYGLIYLANDSQQHHYAIKQIDNHHYDSEVILLPLIKHPNIIHVHEVLKQNNALFVVLEYAHYGDLAKYVRLKHPEEYVPEKHMRSWLLQICLALYHLHHELNIIHRDIKTMNVLVTENELLKLGDFGLAKKINSQDEFTKSAVGTPYYLSPETISSSKSSNKSDMWGLGCLLYELCTGEKPFKGLGLSEIIKNILSDQIGQLPQCYSRWLSDLVKSLLQKNGQKRPSVQSILQDEEMKRQFVRLKQNHKQYECFVYPEISLRTTKYLQRQQKFSGNMKLFSESLKTTKKERGIRLQMEEGFGDTKLKEKKVQKMKFAKQSLRFLLQKRKQ